MTRTAPRGGRAPGLRAATAALAVTALVSCASPEQNTGSRAAPDAADEPSTTYPVPDPADAVRTVVVSDEATATTAPAWPDILASTVADEGLLLTMHTVAAAGAGFAGSPTFVAGVEESAVGSTQLVILFDGRLETDGAATLADAADRTFVAVERAASDARLVVVGPLPGDSTKAVRDALRNEALDAGATYVDPIADNWPADASQEQLAVLLRPHLEELAVALAASGANR